MTKKYIADRMLQEKISLMAQLQDMMHGMDDVIDLSIGDPDFTTPAPIIEAGYKDALAGYTHYTQHRGYPDARSGAVHRSQPAFALRAVLSALRETAQETQARAGG